ncbi:MAG: hypothetical protein RQM92_07775 [Candidatus Syntrophopropionicum ammoniitolerans]
MVEGGGEGEGGGRGCEVIKAFIIPVEGFTPKKHELMQFLKGKLSIYKIPEIFVTKKELPRGANGKVLKRMLK